MNSEYDVIVVGTGAGGSTVAREMTLLGKKVLMLERGGRCNLMGHTLTLTKMYKKAGLTKSKENYNVVFANNYGGASNIAAGCALPPQKEIFEPFGIQLDEEAREAKRDLGVQTLPDELIGTANLRLLEAANSAGYNWSKLENFIDPAKCTGNGDCMLGCKTGAKWTARVYGDEAVSKGAHLRLRTNVSRVIVENGKAIGVEGQKWGKTFRYFAKVIVLSAGMDNVNILRNAGIREAGNGMCCDWLQFVGGIVPGMSTSNRNNPMTVGTTEHYGENGLILTPVFPNWAMFTVLMTMMGVRHIPRVAKYWKYSGIMVKVRDETTGRVTGGHSFSKSVTRRDQAKLDKGVQIIKNIFLHAGAKESSIIALNPMGAHPSATCRIGEVVDSNLETRLNNLYCCDASVVPVALGTPVVWTAVSLGKRLAKHLDKILD